jgi:hypothetical protein
MKFTPHGCFIIQNAENLEFPANDPTNASPVRAGSAAGHWQQIGVKP